MSTTDERAGSDDGEFETPSADVDCTKVRHEGGPLAPELTTTTVEAMKAARDPSADLVLKLEEMLPDRAMHRETHASEGLAYVLSSTWWGVDQQRLAKAAVTALLSQVRSSGAQLTALQHLLLAGPLWAVIPKGDHSPDIVLVDAADRIVAVIEVKSPTAATQWTTMRQILQVASWTDEPKARAILSRCADTPQWRVQVHGDDECSQCMMPKRMKKRDGRLMHTESVHQGDAYRYGRDWVPGVGKYWVHPDAAWFALLPTPDSFHDWRAELFSVDDWAIVRVRGFVEALAETGSTEFDTWEIAVWERFTTQMRTYYGLAEAAPYPDSEWETWGYEWQSQAASQPSS